MGFYYYTARRKPILTAQDGVPIHRLRYSFKPSRLLCVDEEKLKRKLLGPTWRSWERRPLEGKAYLVATDKDGKPYNGAEVHAIEVRNFCGTILDADLGTERFPLVGMLLIDGEGPPQVVTRDEEKAAWKQLGAWWSTGSEALRRNGGGYRPSIDVSLPYGLLAARTYDATAQASNDPRRAYRYGMDRKQSAA